MNLLPPLLAEPDAGKFLPSLVVSLIGAVVSHFLRVSAEARAEERKRQAKKTRRRRKPKNPAGADGE